MLPTRIKRPRSGATGHRTLLRERYEHGELVGQNQWGRTPAIRSPGRVYTHQDLNTSVQKVATFFTSYGGEGGSRIDVDPGAQPEVGLSVLGAPRLGAMATSRRPGTASSSSPPRRRAGGADAVRAGAPGRGLSRCLRSCREQVLSRSRRRRHPHQPPRSSQQLRRESNRGISGSSVIPI